MRLRGLILDPNTESPVLILREVDGDVFLPIWTARKVLDAALENSRATRETDEERIREWLERAGPEDLGKYSM